MKHNVYETERYLSEYLLFHYKTEKEIFPYDLNVAEETNFSIRCAELCRKFSGKKVYRALDLGCAVGRASFELSRFSSEIVAIDFSERFIQTAKQLQKNHTLSCEIPMEGKLTHQTKITLPRGVHPERIHFEKGDAQNLRANMGAFDLILMANLIDRLSDPLRCLKQLPSLTNPHGILVITSPYTWMEEFTHKRNWLGGFYRKGREVQTLTTLRKILSPSFSFLAKRNVPFLIREHSRKFQIGMAEATVWKRK